jgi:4-aminobutyrate aminotransferase
VKATRAASRSPKAPSTSFGPDIRVAPPGPKARAIIARDDEFITPSYTRSYPLVIDRGEGMFVFDADGNRFLDFTAGVAVNALGHVHPEIAKALADQAAKFVHMAGTDFYYGVMADFAKKICGLMPGPGAKQCFLTNSGTESVEAAMKLARYVTKRPRFVAFFNGFHGRSMGSLSLTASKPTQRRHFSPLLADVSHSIYNDLGFLRKWVFGKICPPEDVAAIFVEPIQGEGGYIVPPPGWIADLRALCDAHGILLVADEVQSGIGRTGRLWAIEHEGIEPDIVLAGKGLASGLPLSALIARADLMRWEPGMHGSTFGGNPVACAAALATLELVQGGLTDRAAELGAYLVTRLGELRGVREVRGRGLMVGIDLGDHDAAVHVEQESFRHGLVVLTCGETALRLSPALTATRDHVDIAVGILDTVLG